MPDSTTLPAPELRPVAHQPDDLGIDRAFLLQMAQVPFIAVLLVGLAWVGHQLWALAYPSGTLPNFGPVVVLSLGMILAALIDGICFKVPNWLTLSLVVSGWILGGLHAAGLGFDAGVGTFWHALLGTFVGFILLFFALFIGGMGQGDVKMQMGFGSWIGAIFGTGTFTNAAGEVTHVGPGLVEIVVWSFAFGAIVGGVFGLVMMSLRRKFQENGSNFREIVTDLRVLASEGPAKAAERANARRPNWVRLPYGVPLCVGFLMYLLAKFNGMF